MGSPSVSTHRGLVPWQGLLLVVSILNYWCPPTTAQFAVVPTNAAEGTNVSLRLHNTPPDVIGFVWYRGERAKPYNKIATFDVNQKTHVRGPAYSGREEIIYDGSLMLTNVTLNDTGNYTVAVYLGGSVKEVRFGQLHVYELVKRPILLATNITSTEEKGVAIFICHTNALSIQWLFNGMNLQLSERKKLSEDHSSLTIDPVQREDVGLYRCRASNPVSYADSWDLELHLSHE
ncbi:carcinoembryonic antigen-related cell adhesion molecule 21-like [Phyllostomus discolor]|uniref:Carcinoembryonic antigen-related cell adhesion molecule 21-like n=1 Tax=Phyllostomus discolor TaxID=89673 RepID=A0A7E6CME5_9CHIR|nr:carcinoembryonic antigen-related cell adhesion molecule 21-like [Phyllostomus discolor]XP_035868062.1 carcinoembryonic antigen-related cell adhesion molecule 21-like [Phyllostomus discolor]